MENEIWFRPLVWTDYRLGVLFTVIMPLTLLLWAFVQKAEAIQRLLIIYWRVSSLLLITLYLLIGALPLGFISSLLARLLIPISLWFWVDLNEEIEDQPQRSLKLALKAWRWAITVYCSLGVLGSIPALPCAFSPDAIKSPYCSVWLEPPLLYKQYFHAAPKPEVLGFFGLVGLVTYVVCLSYFLLVRLGKQGRSAMDH